jgi:hypothetical protein
VIRRVLVSPELGPLQYLIHRRNLRAAALVGLVLHNILHPKTDAFKRNIVSLLNFFACQLVLGSPIDFDVLIGVVLAQDRDTVFVNNDPLLLVSQL